MNLDFLNLLRVKGRQTNYKHRTCYVMPLSVCPAELLHTRVIRPKPGWLLSCTPKHTQRSVGRVDISVLNECP